MKNFDDGRKEQAQKEMHKRRAREDTHVDPRKRQSIFREHKKGPTPGTLGLFYSSLGVEMLDINFL